ncbi:putatice ATPase [Bacillus sp. TS-2]|nr:putatice ATPase [Bacillus sp. TS-2]
MIEGFHFIEKLVQEEDLIFYRAVQEDSNQPVLIKTSLLYQTTDLQLKTMKQTEEICFLLKKSGGGVPFQLHYENSQRHKPYLIAPDEGYVLLNDYMKTKSLLDLEFIKILRDFAKGLAELHQHYYIHQGINPTSLVIQPSTNSILLSDFRYCMNDKNQHLMPLIRMKEMASYISPEQTGRVERLVDHRSDFYSLGILLYEWSVGVRPFREKEEMELIHAHISQKPELPHVLHPLFPPFLSKMIMKMLEKNPDNRYQSSSGILKDCHVMREAVKLGQTKLRLSKDEALSKMQFSSNIKGREKEIHSLKQIFSKLSKGESDVVLLEGEEGIGKTALLDEVINRTNNEVQFFYGSFLKGQQHQPYHAIIKGFSDFITQIMTKGEQEKDKWKKIFEEGLGDALPLIGEIFTDLYLIVDPPLKRQTTVFSNNQPNFRNLLSILLQCFSNQKKPTFILIDNFQWVDKASYELFMDDPNLTNYPYIGFLFSYQANLESKEVKMLSYLEKGEFAAKKMVLAPISERQTLSWLEESFDIKSKMSLEKLKEIYHITGGNFSLIQQTLMYLHNANLFSFNHLQGEWMFVEQNIQWPMVNEGYFQQTLTKIQQLSSTAKIIIDYCSCVGFQIDTFILYNGLDIKKELIDFDLQKLEELGIIRMTKLDEEQNIEQIQFIKDSVWQLLYENLESEERSHYHKKIGETILAVSPNEHSVPYEAVDHLNHAFLLVLNQEQILKMMEYNLQVGTRSIQSSAYSSALTYLQTGLRWSEKHTNVSDEWLFQLKLKMVRCHYALANSEEAHAMVSELLTLAKSTKEKIDIYQLEIKMTNHLLEPEKVLKTAIEGLELLQYSFPKRMIGAHILYDFITVRRKINKLEKKEGFDSEDLPSYSESDKMVFSMLEPLGIAVYGYNRGLYALHILRMMKIQYPSFKHENSELMLAQYAMILSQGVGYYSEAYEISKWALNRKKNSEDGYVNGASLFIFAGFLQHWGEPLQNKLPTLMKAFEYNKKAGNLIVAGGSLIMLFQTHMMIGSPLQTLLNCANESLAKVKQIKLDEFVNFFSYQKKILLYLMQPYKSPEKFQEIDALVSSIFKKLKSSETTLTFFVLQKIFYDLFNERYEQCLIEIEKSLHLFEGRNSVIGAGQADFCLYYSLTLCFAEVQSKKELKNRLSIVQKYRKFLRKWSRQSKENFGYRYYFVEGIYFYMKGSLEKAIYRLNTAANLAKASQSVHHCGLIYRILSQIYLEAGRQALSIKEGKKSNDYFKIWGAYSLVEINHLELAEKQSYVEATPSYEAYPLHTLSIDTVSIARASQVLSQEIVIENVLHQLMKIVLENAGANKGTLMLQSTKQLFIEVKGEVEDGQIMTKMMNSISLDSYEHIPKTMIQYTISMQRGAIFNNVEVENRFNQDPYLQKNQPKSIMVIPIFRKKELFGVIYLENQLASYAFTEKHITMIQLLSTQAAISIENARLYNEMKNLNESLEEKVQERTYYLEKTQQEMVETLATKSVLEERNRIARDIHDNVGHTLTTAIVQAEAAKRLFPVDSQKSLEKVGLTQDLVRKGLNEIRRSVKLLNEFASEEIDDFQQEMDNIVKGVEKNSDIVIEVKFDVYNPNISNKAKKMLIHALKEAITNGIRHGECENISIYLLEENQELVLKIIDNGKGNDQLIYGFGLKTMKERVDDLNGTLTVESSSQYGTKVEIRILLDELNVLV